MTYDFDIRESNIPAHIDIEKEIDNKREGVFTFIIKVNNGNIVDLVIMEYADAREYLAIKKVTIQEHTIAYNRRVGSQAYAIRADNFQREIKR